MKMRSTSSQRPVARRHVPQRSCVACRRIKEKREMVRLVLDRNGTLEIDITGKKEGRGAYLCPIQECWDRAIDENQLERALRSHLSAGNREQLRQQGRELLREMNVAEGE